MRGPARGGVGPGDRWVPRGAVGKQELACGPPQRRAALNCTGGREAEREGGGRRRVDLFANSENSRDPL